MPRPKNNRTVSNPPVFKEFRSIDIHANTHKHVVLTLDEYEAFRLADNLGLSHEEASFEMKISRSTFTRLIEKARRKISDFIIHGSSLTIDGGRVHFKQNIIRCMDCGYMFKISLEKVFSECPDCDSRNLLNLAGGFGHGKCCIEANK